MLIYLILAVSIILVNLLPAFAPPTWTLIVFFLNYYNLNIFLVVLIAVFCASIGRYGLYLYVRHFSDFVFNEWEERNFAYLGEKIGKNRRANFIFIFFYAITPLSTTALFVAASVARINRFVLMSAFFLGRLCSYSFLAFTSQIVVKNLDEILRGSFGWPAVLSFLLGLLALLFFAFIDWRELLENKKLKLNFRIWSWEK